MRTMRLRTKVMFAILAALLVTSPVVPASANVPYESYNYNYWEEPVPAPAAYLPDQVWSGRSLGVGDFKTPSDLVVSQEQYVYVLDSGNNRIVIVDDQGRSAGVISSFMLEGKQEHFNNPQGMFITGDGEIYIADTDNHRVVVLSKEGELHAIIQNPESDLLAADFVFNPTKLAVDNADRVYIVARGVYEGLMQFDNEGRFIGYIGTINVNPSAADYMWKMISTKEQRAKMALFVPTEFSNLDIDAKGFLYATNIDVESKEPIKRLSPSGHDVLKRYGYFDVKGDINYFRMAGMGTEAGPSKIIDVKVRDGDMFSMIDSLRGRVFTYDGEGNLLYIFGGKGNQAGTFKSVTAIDEWRDRLILLDRTNGQITLFRTTEFGRKVNEAVKLHAAGDEDEAVAVWQEVLKLNSNYDIAYIGIGKAMLLEKNNKAAMKYFKLGMDRDYYSVAFKRHRKDLMQQSFSTVLTVLALLAAGTLALKIVRKRRQGGLSS